MGFLAVHPKHLRAGLLDDLALLLDGGSVHPVLGVEDHRLGICFGIEHAVDAGQRAVERLLHGHAGDMKVCGAVTEPAGQRLLDDGVDATPERSHGDGLVRRRTGADVHDLDLVEQSLEGREHAQTARFGEAPRIGFRR